MIVILPLKMRANSCKPLLQGVLICFGGTGSFSGAWTSNSVLVSLSDLDYQELALPRTPLSTRSVTPSAWIVNS